MTALGPAIFALCVGLPALGLVVAIAAQRRRPPLKWLPTINGVVVHPGDGEYHACLSGPTTIRVRLSYQELEQVVGEDMSVAALTDDGYVVDVDQRMVPPTRELSMIESDGTLTFVDRTTWMLANQVEIPC